MADDEKVTEDVPTLSVDSLLVAAIDSVKDAEIKLGRLGDYFHELRQQIEKRRREMESYRAALSKEMH